MAQIQLTCADDGKTFVVTVGNLIIISLAENPTTGFRWTIDNLTQEIMVFKQTEFFLDKSIEIGGSGLRKFTFEAKRHGEAVLTLKHWREWEGDASVTKRYMVVLKIR